ncbi:MAG: flagellar hook basal-body protein [Oscillibacter sp.]|nr:flagellar hook basal-body protein [Oscillibacter sp.]
MNQSFFIASVGAHQQLKRLTVHGNNIANLNTYGFKAEKSRFASLMYDDLKASDEEMRPYGVGAALWTTDTDFKSGAFTQTLRDQDYAIAGDGFFAIADLNTGAITLTRNGAFVISELMRPTGEVDENGQDITERIYYLSDNEGRFVLSETGGMIEVEDEHKAQPVGVFDYMNYDGMEHVGDTMFRAVDKNGGIRVSDGEARQGFLEMSNADLAEEMTKVIESQRAYGMALKMVQTSDEIETTINGLRG